MERGSALIIDEPTGLIVATMARTDPRVEVYSVKTFTESALPPFRLMPTKNSPPT